MLVWDSLFGFTFGHPLVRRNHSTKIMKKEFIGPGLHLRPVCVGCAWPPLQWTLNSALSLWERQWKAKTPLWAGES